MWRLLYRLLTAGFSALPSATARCGRDTRPLGARVDIVRTLTVRTFTAPLTHPLSIFRPVVRHMDRHAYRRRSEPPKTGGFVSGNWNGSTGGSRDANREARET